MKTHVSTPNCRIEGLPSLLARLLDLLGLDLSVYQSLPSIVKKEIKL